MPNKTVLEQALIQSIQILYIKLVNNIYLCNKGVKAVSLSVLNIVIGFVGYIGS